MNEDRFLEAVMGMRSKLYHVAVSILWNEQDAADAVQEAMLKGWKRRGTLRDEALFEVWFMRILVNQCRDMQRRQIRGRHLLEDYGRQRLYDAPPDDGAELMTAIRALPEKLRLPLVLYYFDGYSQKEVAHITGATGEQVKARVRQARQKLRGLLENDVQPERGGKARGVSRN